MPTPHDEDEDDAPPLRAPVPSGKKVPAAPAAEPKSLIWGTCAVFHQVGELNEFPGERGVIRYVTSGVRFVQPPTSWEWRSVLTEQGRFELKWSGDPGLARTLNGLRADLEMAARGGQLSSPNHPLLKELDDAAMALTGLAIKLHAVGWSLGLLRPDNVMLVGRDVVPVDLGFAWKGTFGTPPWEDSPGRPTWLEASGPFTWLYDHPPVRQQFADPGNGVYPPPSASEDIRTLGRLFAWLVSGQENQNLPQVRNAPPAWNLISAAANGSISSADELAAQLRTTPLSGYFARPEEPLPMAEPSKPWKALLVVGLLAAIALGAGGLWYFNREQEPIPQPVVASAKTTEPTPAPVPVPKKEPDPEPDPKFGDLLAKIDSTPPEDSRTLYRLLKEAYSKASVEEKKSLDARRLKSLKAWISEFTKADALAAEPSKRKEAAARYVALKTDLELLTKANPAADPGQLAKEKQCLDLVSTRIRELSGSPP